MADLIPLPDDVILQCGICAVMFETVDSFNAHKCQNCSDGNNNDNTDVAENTTDAETPVDGPIASLVPAAYHKYISKSVLKSYVCSNEKEAQFLRKKMEPADIPVIVFNKFKPMYSGVSKNLSEFGLAATRDMKPWLVNLLVDWCSFDEVICKETVSANITESTSEQAPKGAEGSTTLAMIDSQVPSTSSFVEDDLPSVWTSSACKLLISLYEEYQDMFKSPVIKNKTVWEKISGRMQLKGYKFSYTECDQKYRNMKRTYNSHKDNQKKTGRGKKTCPSWYHEMDELLAHKHSINPPKTIELGGAESSGKKSETSNSEIDSGRTNNTEDSSQSEVEDNATECTSPEAGRKKCSSRPNTPESVTKRRNKPNEIVMFLSQRWEEQKKIQEQQHREKMEILKMLVEAKKNSSDK